YIPEAQLATLGANPTPIRIAAVIQRAPAAIGLYSYIKRYWGGRDRTEEFVKQWENARFNSRIHGNITNYNIKYTEMLQKAGLKDVNHERFTIPRYIKSLGEYRDLITEINRWKVNENPKPNLTRVMDYAAARMYGDDLYDKYIKKGEPGQYERRQYERKPRNIQRRNSGGWTKVVNRRNNRGKPGIRQITQDEENKDEQGNIKNIERVYQTDGKWGGSVNTGGRFKMEIARVTNEVDSICFKCNNKGHFARNCPGKNNDTRNPDEEKICDLCGKKGHIKRNCWELKGNESPNMQRERRRNVQLNAQRERQDMKCFNCNGLGHRQNDCPTPPKEELDKMLTSVKNQILSKECWTCRGKGHMSNEHKDYVPKQRGQQQGQVNTLQRRGSFNNENRRFGRRSSFESQDIRKNNYENKGRGDTNTRGGFRGSRGSSRGRGNGNNNRRRY
ncbi:MAG TPA: hypothetical protein VIY08_02905, partial [Candidatus Nitrosocosmicus sp.]